MLLCEKLRCVIVNVSAKDVLVINLVKIFSALVKSALSTNAKHNPCSEYASASAKRDFSVIWRLGLLRSSLVGFWIKMRAQKIPFLFWYQVPLSSQLYPPAAQGKQQFKQKVQNADFCRIMYNKCRDGGGWMKRGWLKNISIRKK